MSRIGIDMHRIYISKGGEKHLGTGNPWLGARLIVRQDAGIQSGDLVAVSDQRGTDVLGCGFYSAEPDALAVRLVSLGASTEIDADELIRRRLNSAAALRAVILSAEPEETDSYRLFHADADGIGGLVVDILGPVAVIQPNTPAMERHLDAIVNTILNVTGIKTVIANRGDSNRTREGLEVTPPQVLSGTEQDEITVTESGLRYFVSLLTGQKTGFYCDQRTNRARFASLVRGWPGTPKVLDLCCYTGGFAMHAARAVTRAAVTVVDESARALKILERNFRENDLPVPGIIRGDMLETMKSLRAEGRKFDLINLDPPKLIGFATAKSRGRKHYLSLNGLALSLLSPGGILMTHSCSGSLSRDAFLEILVQVSNGTGRRIRIIGEGGQGPDHPIHPALPQSRYLKTLVVCVD